jgi:hypothetical protein
MRNDLIWMDPSDLIELGGRNNIGFRMHNCWKAMPIKSEQR